MNNMNKQGLMRKYGSGKGPNLGANKSGVQGDPVNNQVDSKGQGRQLITNTDHFSGPNPEGNDPENAIKKSKIVF